MSDMEIRGYASAKGFHPRTLERWLSWEPTDGDALVDLAQNLKIGENHLRDLMDWLEEICLRDRLRIHEVLRSKTIAHIETDPRLGRADKLKRIKEQVRRLRFPRLAETEDAIRNEIQALELGREIRLSVPSGLEEGSLQVEFRATSHDELKRMVTQLNDVVEKDSVRTIFELLAGRRTTRKQS